MNKIDVYLEVGKKKTFAGAIDWPGWCRSGRDEDSALQALFDYGRRYARALKGARLGFGAPSSRSELVVVERLEGNATTDFGAPEAAPSNDKKSVDEAELARLQSLLKKCWRAFDAAAAEANGKELRKGPRGGGRDVQKIVNHVVDAETGYLSRIGGKFRRVEDRDPQKQISLERQAVLNSLAAAVRGGVPERGPRGGIRWTPRYFVRRVTWHVLDHAWEIQDRVL